MNFNAIGVVLKECDLMRQTSLRETDIDNPTASLECRCAKQSNLQNIRHQPKSTEVSDTTLLLCCKSVSAIPKVSVKIKSNEYLERSSIVTRNE